MSEEFKIEIVNPEKSFLSKEDVIEVVVPAYEGEMGILKNHISIISFLKPGIIKIFSKLEEDNYYVEDGIVEFKNNSLSVLTSSIINIKDIDKNKISELLTQAEENSKNIEITEQNKYLVDQKNDVLKTLNKEILLLFL
jgi:F-type H+-transporting ATPase subunit epsilon/F-type H+-transporting ATPase subunit delta